MNFHKLNKQFNHCVSARFQGDFLNTLNFLFNFEGCRFPVNLLERNHSDRTNWFPSVELDVPQIFK